MNISKICVWLQAFVALILVQHEKEISDLCYLVSFCRGGGGGRRLKDGLYDKVFEEVEEATANVTAGQNKGKPLVNRAYGVNITIPCISIPFYGQAFWPCGHVLVADEPVEIHTPIGSKSIPPVSALKTIEAQAEKADNTVLWVVLGGLILYMLTFIVSPHRWREFKEKVENFSRGELDLDKPVVSEEEMKQIEKERWDVNSEDFIAPGNLFRVLAVLHPGKIGWWNWVMRSGEALMGLWLQVFIPFKVMQDIFRDWTFYGVKTPLWFFANGSRFVTQLIALSSLMTMFSTSCKEMVKRETEANYFILHYNDPADEEEDSDQEDSEYEKTEEGETRKEHTHLSNAVYWNEKFWCSASQIVCTLKALFLVAAMFLTIATFEGEYLEAAVLLTSLFMLLELDRKLLQADSSLRKTYRAAAVRHSHERLEGHHDPTWMRVIGGISILIMSSFAPLGVAGLVLFGWRSNKDGHVLGGNPW